MHCNRKCIIPIYTPPNNNLHNTFIVIKHRGGLQEHYQTKSTKFTAGKMAELAERGHFMGQELVQEIPELQTSVTKGTNSNGLQELDSAEFSAWCIETTEMGWVRLRNNVETIPILNRSFSLMQGSGANGWGQKFGRTQVYGDGSLTSRRFNGQL